MSATNRSKLIAKLQAALKKNYTVPPATPSRSLLEHALYACLLEDCPGELADEGLAKLEEDYFDWNEVRVTTVTELSDVLSSLPDANKAATRLKSNLQGIFEEFYSFDLDHLKKENLGKAVAKFEKLPAMTPFVLSYIIQHGLGGHSIPIDYSAMVVMLVSGIASQSEAADGRIPGLERAIPKSKGVEFASLLHQPAVALLMDPADKPARAFLESVVKGSSVGLDEWLVNKKAAKKRVAKRKAAERETAKQEAETEAAAVAESIVKTPAGKKKPIRSAAKATSTTNKPKAAKKVSKAAETRAAQEKNALDKAARVEAAQEKAAKEKAAQEKAAQEKVAQEKAARAKPKAATKTSGKDTDSASVGTKKPAKKTTAKKPAAAAKSASNKTVEDESSTDSEASTSGGKKAANRNLTKRKPR